jgi:RNA polymerase sigma-70 factor (ECF subfamily)
MKGAEAMHLFGTDEYIERVVKTYSQLLLRIAYTRLGSTADAEDVVQDAFMKLLTKKPAFRDEEHEKAWLIRVTVNQANDFLKSAVRSTLPLDENAASPEDESAQLLSAVLSLPEKYCTVIHLYYYEGYSIKEIARILKLPAATVGTRLARAREKLKLYLNGEEPSVCINIHTEPLSTR